MNELIELLDKLFKDKKMDKYAIDGDRSENFHKDCSDYFNKFKSIYAKLERHMYSEISDYIDGFEDDAIDVLVTKLSYIVEHAEFNDLDETETKTYKCLLKLYDHTKLETKRSMRYRHMERMYSDFTKEKSDAINTLDEAKAAVTEAKDQTKSLSKELIAIVGIFAGIVVTFTFSITTIGEALANLTNTNAYITLFVVFALGIVFVNAIAVLMCFVAKLAGFNLQQKLPYRVLITANVVLIILMVLFVGLTHL